MSSEEKNPVRDIIATALGVAGEITSVVDKDKNLPAVIENGRSNDEVMNADINDTHQNIAEIISVGKIALDDLARVAQSSQHPQAYTALASLMNTVLKAQQDMLAFHAKKKKLIEGKPTGDEDGPPEFGNKITNNLIVGSTSEIAKMIENQLKGNS